MPDGAKTAILTLPANIKATPQSAFFTRSHRATTDPLASLYIKVWKTPRFTPCLTKNGRLRAVGMR